VVLIFGWLGANPRHLRNHTSAYAKLYSKASQIIVQCNRNLFWTTSTPHSNCLLLSCGLTSESHGGSSLSSTPSKHFLPSSSAQRPARILTHVFSNGGSLQMTLLGHMLQRKYGSTPILDSCPAAGDLKSIKLAVRTVIRDPIARRIVLPIVHTIHSIRFGLSSLFGKQMIMLENLRIEMWNPRILPWIGLHTPRLYLFSRKDNLVSCQEVTRHAETAKERGMDVYCELFEESAHVAHLLAEPERHWSSVQEVWAVATKEKSEH
ncbi:hypothetical protein F4604DRAFT_1576483, partial [Suillus subluteus]